MDRATLLTLAITLGVLGIGAQTLEVYWWTAKRIIRWHRNKVATQRWGTPSGR